ncbi:MAG: peptide chain release factor N(5)-glutamine methyltransferase [Chitinophagaceae bacterium]|nr:peptide chain release factor N(5)-glutamine methyltransferase [Chitinophagaceae bacterium]
MSGYSYHARKTEELVEWVISHCKFPVDHLSILDIGTGSGCIPISLKRRIRKADVYGCDISQGALDVARQNAIQLGVAVDFLEINFLDNQQRELLPKADIIVSNPPYIPESNKADMSPNVLDFEPHTALFVPEEDPLLFYKAIASFGQTHLNERGMIFLEIHENLGEAVKETFKQSGFQTEINNDMQGKERMVRCWR